MWISSQTRLSARDGEGCAQVGVVTAGGREAGVYLGGERRWIPVFAPGGYRWTPCAGETVLVLKAGADGEQPCILGRADEGASRLEPGETELYARGCSVRLNGQGEIRLSGRVTVNGEELGAMIARIAAAAAPMP